MCTPRQNNKKGNTPKILLSSKKTNYDQKLFFCCGCPEQISRYHSWMKLDKMQSK